VSQTKTGIVGGKRLLPCKDLRSAFDSLLYNAAETSTVNKSPCGSRCYVASISSAWIFLSREKPCSALKPRRSRATGNPPTDTSSLGLLPIHITVYGKCGSVRNPGAFDRVSAYSADTDHKSNVTLGRAHSRQRAETAGERGIPRGAQRN
jgi:hypothetical protein